MNCLLVITGAYHTDGGIAAMNRLVIQAIAERGHSLDILSLVEDDYAVDPRYLKPGMKVHSRGFAGNKFLFILAVWHAILGKHYSHICVDHVNLASVLAPLVWIKRCNYVVWLCGIEVFPPRPDLEGRLGLRGARKRLAISKFTQQSVAARFPDLSITACDLALDPVRHADILKLNSSALPASVILEASDQSRIELGDRVILHVGRMVSGERYKGQDSLIRAFPLILEKYPDAQLVLAGQGDDALRLKELARELPALMHAHIFFPGHVSDDLLDRIYRRCYVFAMPSVGEGFGLVYLEAMAREKPCLGGNVDATSCVVHDGVTGLLVDDPRSYEQVAERLIEILADPQRARAMGKAGYELVQSYYLPEHFSSRFWNALESDL